MFFYFWGVSLSPGASGRSPAAASLGFRQCHCLFHRLLMSIFLNPFHNSTVQTIYNGFYKIPLFAFLPITVYLSITVFFQRVPAVASTGRLLGTVALRRQPSPCLRLRPHAIDLQRTLFATSAHFLFLNRNCDRDRSGRFLFTGYAFPG